MLCQPVGDSFDTVWLRRNERFNLGGRESKPKDGESTPVMRTSDLVRCFPYFGLLGSLTSYSAAWRPSMFVGGNASVNWTDEVDGAGRRGTKFDFGTTVV